MSTETLGITNRLQRSYQMTSRRQLSRYVAPLVSEEELVVGGRIAENKITPLTELLNWYYYA